MRRAVALVLCCLPFLAACSAAPQPTPLTVFGASSLKYPLDSLKGTYEALESGTVLTISTGASSALRAQLEQIAPADVFLSADTTNPQALVDAGLVDGSIVTFARNGLIIVVPVGNPAHVTSPADLARANLRIIAAGEDVPITHYAEQTVANLSTLPGYPADFAAAYDANIVSREDNVGAVVAKVRLGEGDAAIVYVTDANAAAGGVQVVRLPGEVNVAATYSGVVLKRSTEAGAAHDFLDWLRAPMAQEILSGFAFWPAP